CAAAPAARAQAEQGSAKLREAVSRDKRDAHAWHDLAEALAREGDSPGALRAYREAVKLYRKRLEGMRFVAPTKGREPAGQHRDEIVSGLRRAPEAVGRYLALESRLSGFERSQLEAAAGQAAMLRETDASRSVFFGSELESKARIIYKPEPVFGEYGGTGVVRVRAVLGSDGRVKHIFVIKALGGQTENAVAAARRVRFEPAVKDGRPVSQFILLEYNFNIY
ncbi:MAG TPA: energy transducer TonB, partial [Pyrinomonadaceae bacterium]|nr:energy transducer TonB [Pyrinomonadaceae bacterium]